MLNIELNLVEQFIIKNSNYQPLKNAITRIKEYFNKVDNTIDNKAITAEPEEICRHVYSACGLNGVECDGKDKDCGARED